MAKPVLFAIDDDPEVLRAIDRDLRREYGEHYRVMRADSGPSALEALETAQGAPDAGGAAPGGPADAADDRGRVPGEGDPALPAVKQALLTAYADTDAAIRAINTAQIDYYLIKPWDPPERGLYPVLNDLLADWQASFRPPFEGIRVIGHRWSPDAFQMRDFLARHQVPYHWMDVESDGGQGAPRRSGRRAPCRWSSSPTAPASQSVANRAGGEDRPADAGGEAVLRPDDRRRRPSASRRRSTAPPRGCAR